MAKIRLTDGPAGSIWKKAPPGKTLEYFDTIQPGLTLRIGARGGSYLVIFRVEGEKKQLRRKIGTPHTLDLEEARAIAKAMIVDARKGISPDQRRAEAAAVAEAAKEAERRAAAATFKAVADLYLGYRLRGGGHGLASRPELERKLKVDLAAWHSRPIVSISRREIKALIQSKAEGGAGAASNRLLSFIKRVFRWALDQELVDVDPSSGISPVHEEQRRTRWLTAEEIRWFWLGCKSIGDPAGRLFKLCLATGQRRGEVGGMRRSEIGKLTYGDDLQEVPAWLLPAERTKRGVAHALPLSKLALELIEGAPKMVDEDGEELEDQPDHLLTSGRRGDQPVSGWSRYKAALDTAIGEIRAEELSEPYDPEKHDLAPWHVHDLRATASTHMKRPPLKISKATISYVLNHAEGDIDDERHSMTAVYLREGAHADAIDALERWGEKIREITAPTVTPFRKRRAA